MWIVWAVWAVLDVIHLVAVAWAPGSMVGRGVPYRAMPRHAKPFKQPAKMMLTVFITKV